MELESRTNGSLPRAHRWYRDACGTALAMDLVGERWSLLIMRELLLGPRRFGEIRGGLSGISANVLTQRLDGLEKAGIVRRRLLPSPANVQVYALTPWGQRSEEAIFALSRWAAGSPAHDVTLPLSNTAFMLSLKTMIAPTCALACDLGFRVGGEPFRAGIADRGLKIERADPDGAALIFAGDPSPLAATFYGGDPLAESERLGRVRVTGDRTAAQAFVDCFALPRFDDD